MSSLTGSVDLHDKLSSPWHSSLSDECVDWFLFLFGLLYLDQSGDGIDALPILWVGLLLQFDEISRLLFGRSRRSGGLLFGRRLARGQRWQFSQFVQHEFSRTFPGRLFAIAFALGHKLAHKTPRDEGAHMRWTGLSRHLKANVQITLQSALMHQTNRRLELILTTLIVPICICGT